MNKVMSAQEAVKNIKDGDMIATGGFVGCGVPEELAKAVEARYLEEGSPNNVGLVYAAGQGDGKEKGLNHFGHDGLIKRVVGGHWGLAPQMARLAMENKVEAYNLPQGVITHMFRDTAAGRPGTLSHVGLHTFVDPRKDGGKINEVTTEDIVELTEVKGKEYLFYQTFPINVALIRATYADAFGNAVMTKEAGSLEVLSMAQAAKNSGGIVIVQVEKVVEHGTLDPKLVKVPGILVDAIVESTPDNHMQTFAEDYNPAYSGEVKASLGSLKPLPLNERKVIARRAAMELVPNAITNLGIGVPEGVAAVASEEGVLGSMRLTVESGPIGGMPAGGLSFGAATNPDAIIDQPYQFDFYDGGGLDMTFLGLAQLDQHGNVNVSKFGTKVTGAGGFINISQNAQKVIFCGTFTAGGLKVDVGDGQLTVTEEGRFKKFINQVEQTTFSGPYAAELGRPIMYVTERAVFELNENGLVLTETAPGIDPEKDIFPQMDFRPQVADELKTMDARIFTEAPMGLDDIFGQ